MAILNFPQNPNIGDTYAPIGSSKVYGWSGSAWLVINSSNTSTGIVANTLRLTSSTNVLPQDPTVGTLIVDGGAYIQQDLVVGGFLYLNASPVITTASFSGQANEGVDIDIIVSMTNTGALIFNNISTLHSVTGRGNSTTNYISFLNDAESISTDSGAVTVLGGLGVGKRINSESLQIADTVFDSTKTTVDTVAQYLIDSYSLNNYRSSKYFIQIDEGTTSTARFQCMEIMLVASNTGTAFATEYGIISSNGTLGSFSKDVTNVGGDWVVNLYFTPNDTVPKTIKVLRTAMTV